VRAKPWTNGLKVDAVGAVRQVLYAGRLELPDHRRLVEELVTLEQRPLPSGRPHIAAPGRAHDDNATAAMALVLELADPHEPDWAATWRAQAEQLSAAPTSAPVGPTCGQRLRFGNLIELCVLAPGHAWRHASVVAA
jgi:hypothetical protein